MKKFLSYVLTFFIMFFMSAGVTVWFSQSRGNNGIVNPEQNVGGASGSSFFTQLLETFNTEKQFKIKGDLNIDYNDMEIPLFVDVNIDINDTNNIKLEGVIIIDIDGNDFTFDFVYHSNVVYLSYNDIYVKLAVSDINSILGTIKELIPSNQNSNSQNNVQTPEQKPTQSIDFNKLLDQYMPTIMAALNNIEETELENGDKKYTLKIEKLAEAGLICNSEDVLKSVELETANFDGLQVGANLSIKFDKELEVVDPSQDVYFSKYIDVSNALNIVKNTLNKRDLNLFAGVKINENSVSANLGYDFNTKNFKATLINNSYGYVDSAKVVFVDGDLYLTVNNAKFLINEQMIKDCSPLIKDLLKQINIEESLGVSQKTTELVSRVKELFDNNVASILAIVQNIELTNSCITLKFDSSILGLDVGILNIAVNIDEDSINSLSISGVEIDGQSIEINAELKEEQIDYSVQDVESYLDVYEFYNQNKYLFDAKEFDVSLAFDILMDGQEKNINIDALISKDYINVDCELIGNLYNKLGLIYKDGFLYVGVNDAKVKIESDKVFEVLKNLGLEGKIQGSINSLSGQIADKVQDLTIEDILSLLVVAKDINVSSSGVKLSVSGDIVGLSGNIDLVVNFEQGKIKSISVYGVEVDNNKFDVDVVLNKTSVEPIEINEEDYLNVSWALEKINSILSATNGTITLKADVGYGEQIFNIDLSLCGSIEEKFAKIVLALNGTYDLDLNANYYNDKLFANMGEAFISVDLEYILGILGLVQENVDIESIKNELTSTEIDVEKIYLVKNLMTFIKGIKYEDLRKINVVANASGLTLTLDKSILNTEADFVLSISFVSENVTNVSFTKVDVTEELNIALNLTIDTTPVEQSAVEVEEEKYLDVKETISRVEEILSNTNGTITLKADVGYGEQVFNIDLSLCGSVEEKFAKIVLALNGTYDLDLNANYYEDKLYTNMGDAFISVDLEYILGVLGLVQDKVDLESIKNELTSTEIDVEKIYLVKNLMTFIKGIKYEDLRKINVVANASGLTLTLDKSILNTDSDFVLSISFVSENVTNISFTKVDVTEELNIALNLTIDTTPVEQTAVEVEEEKYLDVKETISRVEEILSTTNGTITLKADIGYGEQIFNIDLSLCGSIEEKFAKIVLTLNGTYDLDLNANYYEDKLYANMGEAFVSVDLEYILGMLGLVQGKVDLESLKNELTSTEIDIEKIYIVKNLITFIKGIKYEDLRKINVVANAGGLTLTLDKSILKTEADFVLSISFVSEQITNISFTKVNITEDIYVSVNLTVNTTPVVQSAVKVEEEKYLDVASTIERIENILETTNGTITLKADIGYGEQIFNIDLSLCGSIEEKFAKIVLALNGTYDLDLNANYYNDKLFANMGDAFVSVDLEYILGVLGLVQDKVDVEGLVEEVNNTNVDLTEIYIVKNLLNFVQNIKYEDLKKVNIVANNNGLTLTLDKSILNTETDFVLSISFVSENVTNVSFTKVNITEDVYASVNLTIDVTPVTQEQVEVDETKYLDVATTIERIENIRATTNGTITLKADIGYGEQIFNIDLNFCGSVQEKFAKIVLSLNGTYDLDLNANYYEDKLYANMGNAFVSVDLEYILGVLGLVKENVDIESIKNELTSTEIDIEKIYIVKNLLNFVQNIKYEDLRKINIVANANGLTLTLDKSILNTDSDFVLSISFVSESVTNISFTKINIIEDIYASVNLTVDTTPVEQSAVEVEEEKYLDVETTIERVENILATTNGTITLKADIGYGEQIFNIDLSLCGSVEEKFAKIVLALNGTYDLNLNANYYEDKLYANMGDAFVSVDLEYILGVLGLVKENVDVESIKNEITSTEIDVEKIYLVKNLMTFIKGIKYEDLRKISLVANSNGVVLTLDKSILNTDSNFVLSISFVSENITNITFTKVDITEELNIELNLTIDTTPVEQSAVEVEEEKYLDVATTIERVENILATTNGTITLKADIGYGEQVFNIDLSLCGSVEEKFAKIVLALNGTYDLDLNANYYNDKAFIDLEEIMLSVGLADLKELLAEFKIDLDKTINDTKEDISTSIENTNIETSDLENILIIKNLLNFVQNIKYEDLKKVNIVANNNGLTLTLDKSILNTEADFVLSISFVSENVTNVSFTKVNITEDIYASLDLTIDITPVEQTAVMTEEEKYLDLRTLMDNLEEIIDGNNIWIDLEASLFTKENQEYLKEMGVDLEFGKQLVGVDLKLYALVEYMYKEYGVGAKINYSDSTLFASALGLNVKVDNGRIIDSVHTILAMFVENEKEYDDILGMIVDILSGNSIIEEIKQFTKGRENTSEESESGLTIKVDYKYLLSELTNNISINSNMIDVSFNLECLGLEGVVEAVITLSQGKIVKIEITKLKIKDRYLDVNLALDYTAREEFPVISEEDQEKYIDIAETANLLESTVETLTKKTISGQITVKFDKEGEVDATIDYGIKIVEGNVEAYLTTTFKGVPIDIRYKYDTFYLDIVGLKVYLEFSSINDLIAWINEEFDTNITFTTDILDDIKEEFKNLDKTLKSFDIENVMKNLSSVDLSFINYVKYTQNMAEVLLDNDYKLNISYGESVDSVQLVIKEKLLVSLTCCEYNDFTNQNIYPVDNELNVYKPYTDLIDLYDSVMETINQKQFDITANAKAYKEGKETYNVDIFDFAFDITDGLNAYGSALVTGEEDVEFDAAFKDEKLYVNYDGLKVAMSWDAIKELLVIVLELVGVDPTTIGFLKDVADEMQVNADNLGNYLPGMDFDNPLNSIKHIKNISFNDGMFSITIDGKLMNPEATTYMDIVIGTSEKGITSASINNFFTGTSDERFDLMVNLNEFNGVKDLADAGTYHDLSNATDLIKAFINTSSLHDYHISGKLKLGIIGIDGLASINVDAQIKSDEEGNVVAAVELNNYPLVGVVNGGNTNGLFDGALATFRKRSISLYFENDTVYLKTVDEKTTFAKQYNRVTKVKGAALIDNIGYYIQWLLGFKDSIQKEIDQLIYDCTHFTGETDMGNILKEYNLESDGLHKLVINLGEIAHTADIEDATLYIATTKVTEQKEQTKEDGTTEIVNVEKDYIYSLDMGVEMLDGTITIDTDSNNKLYLVDIGLPVDVSSAENHINQYPYNLDAEYKKEGTMDASNLFAGFTQTNANTVYVSFDTDGGNALSDISGTIGANMTLPTPTKVINGVTYQFIGWYYEDGVKCELTSYPRSNLTLYARWFKYTLSFETNGGFDIASREEYEGTLIELPTPTKYVDRGDMRTYYTFEGWFLNPEFEGDPVSSVTLKDNTTVYAKWKEERKAETRTLYVYSNGRLLLKERYEIGASITLPEGIVGSTRIVDKKNVDYSVYTCTGWDKEVSVMGNKEITVTAIWELTTYKKYYKINFVVEWYDAGNNGVSYDDLNTKPDTSAIEEEYWVLGDGDFEIPDFGITAQDKHGFLNLSTRNYKVVGWKTTPASYGSSAEYTTSITNVSSNMTLYAVWQKV